MGVYNLMETRQTHRKKYLEGKKKKTQEAAYKQSQLKLYRVIYMTAERFLDWVEGRIIRESSILRLSSE